MLRESVPVPLNHNTLVWTCGTSGGKASGGGAREGGCAQGHRSSPCQSVRATHPISPTGSTGGGEKMEWGVV